MADQTRDLSKKFSVYWGEMALCIHGKAYWSLLHMSICLPDICSALEVKHPRKSVGARYKRWCKKYLANPLLWPEERWDIRNKILHQGTARPDREDSRYNHYFFGQPAQSGYEDHMRPEGQTLHLDVGLFANETRHAVEQWIEELKNIPESREALNVAKNLDSLVEVSLCRVSVDGNVMIWKTN
jgi:hypothetical protein